MFWLLNTKDKVEIRGRNNEVLVCPPHCVPHKLPFTAPVTDEHCHYHTTRWRMQHHIIFCFLFCKNYKKMMEKYGEYKKSLKSKKSY